MQLEKTPFHNSKGTPSHLSQLERNTKSSTTTQLESFAITRKDPPGTKLGHPLPKLGRIPLPKLDRSFPAHCI